MIVEIAPASAKNGLRSELPGEAQAGRDLFGFSKARIIVPADAKVQGQLGKKLPVILKENSVVVVAKMNFVGLRRKPAFGEQEEEPGVDGAKLRVVGHGGKELVGLNIVLDAIHTRVHKIPTPLDGVAAPGFRDAGAESPVELIDVTRSQQGTKGNLAEVAEDSARIVPAEGIEERAGTGFWMRWTARRRLAAILPAQAENPRTGGVA